MTRGTLFYYESPLNVWTSTEFNGDMYHGTSESPEGVGDDVIKLMQNLKNLDDFKSVLKKINKHYGYDEGNDCWSVAENAIDEHINSLIKWIEEERKDLRGDKNFDPRTWKKKPSFKDVTTWQFWGMPNLSDYSYIYNNSGEDLVITTKGTEAESVTEIVIPDGGVGVLNYGHNDCICKNGKIIDGMGNYKTSVVMGTNIGYTDNLGLETERQFDTVDKTELALLWFDFCKDNGIIEYVDEVEIND